LTLAVVSKVAVIVSDGDISIAGISGIEVHFALLAVLAGWTLILDSKETVVSKGANSTSQGWNLIPLSIGLRWIGKGLVVGQVSTLVPMGNLASLSRILDVVAHIAIDLTILEGFAGGLSMESLLAMELSSCSKCTSLILTCQLEVITPVA
jgi:hypothetical protein